MAPVVQVPAFWTEHSIYMLNWKELAEFVGKDEALCFSTGFTVNEGIIPAVVGRGDYIICDDRDHASIVDGPPSCICHSVEVQA